MEIERLCADCQYAGTPLSGDLCKNCFEIPGKPNWKIRETGILMTVDVEGNVKKEN